MSDTPKKEENPMDGAIVRAADLPKVMRLENYGFKLKAKPTQDGRIYVEVHQTPGDQK